MKRSGGYVTFGIAMMLLGGVSGCGTLLSVDPTQIQQNRVAALRSRCQAYGFQDATADMAACVERLDAAARKAEQREGVCMLAMSAALGQPTRTGSTAEGFANGNAAYAKCMAGQAAP